MVSGSIWRLWTLLFATCLLFATQAQAYTIRGHIYPTVDRIAADLRSEDPRASDAVIAGRTAGRLEALSDFVEGVVLEGERNPPASLTAMQGAYRAEVLALNQRWNSDGNKCLIFRLCDAGRYYYAKHDAKYQNEFFVPMVKAYAPASFKDHRLPEKRVRPVNQGIWYLLSGIGLFVLVSVIGVRLRRREIVRANANGVVEFDTAGGALGHEMGVGLFKGFARLAVTAGVILSCLGLLLLVTG